MRDAKEGIRERVLMLIDSEYESDAAFEREMELAEKTVSNWRRAKSSSFMRILPELSDRFGVNLGELFDMPIRADSSELSDEETEILTLYRKSHVLPKRMRVALRDTIEATINMYVAAASDTGVEKKGKK